MVIGGRSLEERKLGAKSLKIFGCWILLPFHKGMAYIPWYEVSQSIEIVS